MKLFNLINFLINNPCEDPNVLKVILFIRKIMEIAFIAIPIVLIVLITFDFIKSVMANSEDTMKKNQKIVIKRLVYAVMLFFVMPIVNVAFSAFGTSGNYDKISADFGEQEVSYLSCWDNAKGDKKTIEANFKITAIFNPNGGTLFGEKEKSCGGSLYCEISNPPRVTKKGYDFLGWSNDSCFTYIENKVTINKNDSNEFVACWGEKTEEDDNNESILQDGSVASTFWWPIEKDSSNKPKVVEITSGYGERVLRGEKNFHYGIDISDGTSPKIIASYGGYVFRKDVDSDGYGTYVVLKHSVNGEAFYTVYAHMKAGSVPSYIKKDSWVEAGTVLGTMGSTGNSTGIHLHFEMRKGGWDGRSKVAVNPLKYVSSSNPYPKKTWEDINNQKLEKLEDRYHR